MAKSLSLLDQSSDSEVEFTINKNYAGKYDFWRNKEEMQKLKDLSKDISDTSSSSEDEAEPIIEKDFLKTLSLIKSKDPVIYNENVEFFKEENALKKPKIKKEKPMFMKDYERKIILERNGEFSDEDGDRVPSHSLPEELDEVTKSLKAALDSEDETQDSQVGGLFQVRTKSEQEKEDEAEEYLQWLKGQEKNVDKETKKELSFLRRYWNDSNLDEGEKFLRDYLLNQNFTDKSKTDSIPSYGDITEDFDTLVEEEETLKQQEQFEQKYNFRFEEPDPEFIKRYPRTVGDSLRRVDNKRKMKREDYTERKKREKDLKREELKRLKALKRKEIEEKFFKLKEASGKEEINFDEHDIESDFDPDKHDEKMKELFNDDYYAVEEEQKPEFLHDDEIDDEDWDHWTRAQADLKASEKGPIKHEDEGDSSANDQHTDLNTEFEREMLELTHSKRRGRRKSLFAKLISQPKPLYDPDGKSFEKYLEEYYNLDYEDVIGDLPVRFKYRKVIPNDFGLTADEILAADDKELNRWCSVKKTCQYRRDEEEIFEVQAFKKKAQNTAAKEKILASVYAPPEEKGVLNTNDSKDAVNIPKRKKKRSKKKKLENSITNNEQCNSAQEDAVPPAEESLKDLDSTHVGENLLETKKEKKRRIGCVEISFVASAKNDVESSLAAHENVSKKKRKHKNKADSNDGTVLDSSQMSDTREGKYTKDNGERDSSIHDPKSSVGGNEQSNSPSKRSKKRRRNKSLHGKGLNIVISASKPQHTASHGDKRLDVSDSRLAAFGINPKKFKNVIIYSSKK